MQKIQNLELLLYHLNLKKNKLDSDSFPSEMKNLTSLYKLNLDGNQLTSCPKVIHELFQLITPPSLIKNWNVECDFDVPM